MYFTDKSLYLDLKGIYLNSADTRNLLSSCKDFTQYLDGEFPRGRPGAEGGEALQNTI
jgi:hypothetical protein